MWGKVLPVLLVFFSCTSFPDFPPHFPDFPPQKPTQVFTLQEHTALPVSLGTISNKNARLLWDTGSSYNVLSNASEARFQQASGLLKFQALRIPSPIFHQAGFVGLLGGSCFQDRLVIFNFVDHTVILTTLPLSSFETEEAIEFSFSLEGNRPLCRLTVGSQTFTALIDTGSMDVLTLPEPEASKIGVVRQLSDVSSQNVFTAFRTRRVVVPTARILGQELTNPVVSLEAPDSHSVDAEGKPVNRPDPYQAVIGYGFLQKGILSLDYRTGLGFWRPDDKWRTVNR